jgi:hypothetical protein
MLLERNETLRRKNDKPGGQLRKLHEEDVREL